MTSPKPTREERLAHCGELRDDDGIDPREYFKKPTNPSGRRRKTYQLCSQIADALSQILASEFDDDRLLHLQVLSVEPSPDVSQLLVTLRYDGPDDVLPHDVVARLSEISGILRSQIAAVITRRRTPRLTFRLV